MNEKDIVQIILVWIAVVVIGLVVGIKLTSDPLLVGGAAVGFLIISIIAFRGIKTKGLTPFQAVFYLCFTLTLILVWSPIKLLAYLTPIMFILIFVFVLSTMKNSIVLSRVGLVLVAWLALSIFYMATNPDFIMQNSLLAMITYGSILPLLIIPNREIAGQVLLDRCVEFLQKITLIQGCIGTLQGLYGAIIVRGALWDFVEGTMHIQPSPSGRLDSVMFASNMSISLILLFAYRLAFKKKNTITLSLGVASLIFGSVVHLIMVLSGVLLVTFMLVKPKVPKEKAKRYIAIIGLFMLAFPLLLTTVLKERVQSLPRHYERAFINNRNPKIKMITRTFTIVRDQYPLAPIIGLGPGQYGSRACVISAGYLRRLPRPFETLMTKPFMNYGLDLWLDYFKYAYRGSTDRPASSWAAIINEFGLLGVIFTCTILSLVVTKARKAIQDNVSSNLCFGFIAGSLLIFFLGFQEHYWEVPQAIFAGCLILKLFYANLINYNKPYGIGPAIESDTPRLNMNKPNQLRPAVSGPRLNVR